MRFLEDLLDIFVTAMEVAVFTIVMVAGFVSVFVLAVLACGGVMWLVNS